MATNTSLLEADPLNLKVWEQIRIKAAASGDFLGIKTLPVVIEGIRRLNERLAADYPEEEEALFKRLTGMQRAALVKLVSSYNNPGILKDIGMLYLGEFRLPEVAATHFQRALELNQGDETLEDLIHRAEAAVKARQNTSGAGVEEHEHARKRVASMMRRTGKVALTTQQLSAIAPPPTTTDHSIEGDAKKTSAPIDLDAVGDKLPESDDEALEIAYERVRQGQVDQGLDAAQEIADRTDNNDLRFIVWTEVAYACFQGGHFAQAVTCYGKARDAAPDILMSWFNYGLALHVAGRYDEALEAYRHGDTIEANHPKVWCNLGALYFQMDQFDASEQALRKAVEIRPSYARAWDNLAAALGAQDKLIEARHACQRALALRPEFPEAWFKLAMIQFHDNETEDSENSFRNALNHDALAPFALNYLSQLATGRGDIDKGEQFARDATDLDPRNPVGVSAWVEIGVAAYKHEQWDRAIAALTEATRIDSHSFESWFNLGRTHEAKGELAEARDAYVHATEIRPESYGAYHRLGRTARALEDLGMAIKAYTRLAELAPDDEIPWRRLADALEAKGLSAEANEALLTAESLVGKPDRSVAHLTAAINRIRTLAEA